MPFMKPIRYLFLSSLIYISLQAVGINIPGLPDGKMISAAQAQATNDATPLATMSSTSAATAASGLATACNIAATPTTNSSTLTPTVSATSPTVAAEMQPTALVTQQANAPLYFESFLPTDIRFNPNPDKPVALVMVFSLVFQNQLGEALHIESPRFKLAINGVSWGTLSSTDFQTGQLLSHAEQGIVLQNLTIIAKTTPEQQSILPCLKAHIPVDLTLSGTIESFPGGNQQSVTVNLITPHVIITEHN